MHTRRPLIRYLTALSLIMPVVASVPRSPADLGEVHLAAETSSAYTLGDTIAVRVAGRIASTSPSPNRLVFDGPMTALGSGEPAGNFTSDLSCHGAAGIPCGVYEVINTFEFSDSSIVTKSTANVAPDATAAGFFHVGIHPDADNITHGTGIFAGRTGTAHMSGRHDGHEFPAAATFDDFWLIQLDPQ